jgi:hypothetical protein
MQATARIRGLDGALKSLQAAFPNNPKQQQRIVNGAMGGSARKSFLPIAKQLAKRGDSSGALSEALAVRAMGRRKRRGRVGGMEVVPVRNSTKAMALYISHYFTERGKNPSGTVLIDGIRHGHLVEFGTAHSAAYPYLWPAAVSGSTEYRALFANELKKRIEGAVRRAAKKRAKK